jgi:uncharacterized protein YdhG (YjbR/CyaY superfamily)
VDVDEYLASVPEPQQSTLRELRRRLRAVLPDADEVIRYGVPAFLVDGVAVAGYAAAARHCSYYPMSGEVLPGLSEQLAGYNWSKGTLRFPVDQPLAEHLVAALVAARLRAVD